MELQLFLLFIIKLLYVNPFGLEISPKDIILTKNGTIKVNCTINKNISIAIENVKFKFVIDKESAMETQSDYHTYLINNSFVKILNNHTIYLEHDVYYPKFHNSVLECYVNDSLKYRSAVLLGEFPHNATNASCFIQNWTDMHCEFNTSEINKIFTTHWNFQILDKFSREIKMNGTMKSSYFTIKNIFNIFTLNDSMELILFGNNTLGIGNRYSFEFQLKDIVVPDAGHLNIRHNSINYTVSLLLEHLKSESFEVLMDINCSNVIYRFKEISRVLNEKIVINLDEKALPASKDCSTFIKIKPLDYGKWSVWSNTVLFSTQDRVPLKNLEMFNSSFEIYECNLNMTCDIHVYFKSLNNEEAQGNVLKYRVTVKQDGNVDLIHYIPNNGLPFISIEGVQMSHNNINKDYFVTIQAETVAGFNKTLHAKPIQIKSTIESHYSYLLTPNLINASKSLVKLAFFYIVILNESHVDIVYKLDDHSENIYMVWCLNDKFWNQCRANFGWQNMTDVKGVMRFVVPSNDELKDYKFGMQVSSGLQWMDSSCYFIATSDFKPDIPNIVQSNKSHLAFDISPPTCSRTTKTNFPGGYIIEYFEIEKSDTVKKRTYSHFDAHINLDNIDASIYNISVYALPWNSDGKISERFYFQYSSIDVNHSEVDAIYFVVFIGIFVSVSVCICLLQKRECWCWSIKPHLKVEIPTIGQHEPEQHQGYSAIDNNLGYKSCSSGDAQLISNTDLKLSDDSGTFIEHEVASEEHDSYSGLNYAVTKLVDRLPIIVEGLQKPAKQISIPELFESQSGKDIVDLDLDLPHENVKNNCDHSNYDINVRNNNSNDSSLPDYPSVKVFNQFATFNNIGQIFQNQDVAMESHCDVKRMQISIEDDLIENDNGYADDGSEDDSSDSDYCKRSKFINLPFIQTIT